MLIIFSLVESFLKFLTLSREWTLTLFKIRHKIALNKKFGLSMKTSNLKFFFIETCMIQNDISNKNVNDSANVWNL